MKKGCKKIISALICLSILATGCGKTIPEAPSLLEPVSANEAFRPVEYGDIGINKKNSGVVMGVVVPKTYCHFWTSSVQIKEVYVNVGDYVTAGDVLAVADIDVAKKIVEDLNGQLNNISENHDINESIYSLERSRLEYEKEAYELAQDTDMATLKAEEIGVLDENNRYENILYQHRVSDLKENIANQEEIISDGTLRARVSGYVVYSKELSGERTVFSDENVVVVADYNDCYIEVKDVSPLDYKSVSELKLNEYESCYTLYGKEKRPLKEYEYSSQEKLVAENKKSYPPLRLLYADGTKPENVGEFVPVFLIKNGKENVLRVGRDSLFSDAEGDYVYVKTEGGKEKRYVKLGDWDKNYQEVLEGLSEGELVFYSTEELMPSDYEEYEVVSSDYVDEKKIEIYSLKNYNTFSYYSEYEGQITELNFKSGSTVNEGELVCTVKTDQGCAMITELKKKIDNLKDGYGNMITGYDNQLKEIDDRIYLLDNPPEATALSTIETATLTDATPSDAWQEAFVNPYEREILVLDRQIVELQKKLAGINYDYQMENMSQEYENLVRGNDGNGTISVYAERSGKMSNVYISKGKNVNAGEQIFNLQVAAPPLVRFSASSISLGQRVSFKTVDGKAYYGNIVSTGSDDRFYSTIVGDKVYITQNRDKQSNTCCVSMEDESFYDIPISEKITGYYVVKNIPNSVVLPKSMVYKEVSATGSEEKYYVWKIASGELVKTYVILADSSGSGGSFCIIEGVMDGDILARELTETEKNDKAGQ